MPERVEETLEVAAVKSPLITDTFQGQASAADQQI